MLVTIDLKEANYLAQLTATASRQEVLDLLTNILSGPLNSSWDQMLIKNVLDHSGTFLVPNFHRFAEAVRRKSIIEPPFEIGLRLHVKVYMHSDEELRLGFEDLKELRRVQHLADGLFVKIFEVLRKRTDVREKIGHYYQKVTYEERMALIDLGNTLLSGHYSNEGILFEDVTYLCPEQWIFAKFDGQDHSSTSQELFSWQGLRRIRISKLFSKCCGVELLIINVVDV